MARQDKLALLREIHEESDFEEIEGSNHIRINGERAYVLDPTRALSVKHELVADLAATGLKPAEIGRLIKTNASKSDGGYYATLLRDPRIRSRARSNVSDVVDLAKEKLKGVVTKATQNICDAVEAGDVKESHFVLAVQGVSDKAPPIQANVNLDFGSWMGQLATANKTQHDIAGNTEQRVINDETALPETTGKTLEIK
jgi:hypothetical protein